MKAAFCTFCDDIRQEASGKLLLVGTYLGEMAFPSIPAVLPRLHIIVDIVEDKSDMAQSCTIRVTPPGGDPIEINSPRIFDDVEVRALRDDPDIENLQEKIFLTLPDLEFRQEGRLKVDVVIDGTVLRAGSLKVKSRSPQV